MLSKRGERSAASQDIPWRFAPGLDNRYDEIANPDGKVILCYAENVSSAGLCHCNTTYNA
jgi:1-aminocyclopropane-1-carboxylate synthase